MMTIARARIQITQYKVFQINLFISLIVLIYSDGWIEYPGSLSNIPVHDHKVVYDFTKPRDIITRAVPMCQQLHDARFLRLFPGISEYKSVNLS